MIEMEDRGPLDLTRQIEEKDAQIKKLCAEVGNLEFQISDYRQIVKELSAINKSSEIEASNSLPPMEINVKKIK